MSKPKVIIDFDKLEESLKMQIKLNYPSGFEKHLIAFKNHKKHLISALPFEGDERHYLVKMTREKANEIILADDDYNENGMLKAASKIELEKELIEIAKQPKKAPEPKPVVEAKPAPKAKTKTKAKTKAAKKK